MLGDPRESDLEPHEWAAHQKEQASAWGSWHGAVAGLLVTMTAEEDARAELESRYLGGQPSLLGDAAMEWSRFGELVDALWTIAERLMPLTRAEERGLPKDALERFDERVQERVRTVADDARIETFDRLGENSRTLAILETRLGR